MHKVLIVDDNEVSRLRLKRMKLWGEASGFEIAGEANDGVEAARILALEHYDLVFSDIRMPKMDGIEMLATIRGKQLAAFVVLMSEFADFDAARQGMVHGASDYLVKPVEESSLLTVLKRLAEKIEAQKFEHVSQRDIDCLKQCLCEGSDQSGNAAVIVSRKVWSAVDGDEVRAIEKIGFVLREAVAYLSVRNPWMNKFINPDQLIDSPEKAISNLHEFNAYVSETVGRVLAGTRKFRQGDEFGPIISNAIRYVLTNIDRNISHQDIANDAFVNASYLSQLFKEKTGMTMGMYVADLKVERAKRLLEKREMKVCEMSIMLGYADVEYFSRLFKHKVGCTPKEYQGSVGMNSL